MATIPPDRYLVLFYRDTTSTKDVNGTHYKCGAFILIVDAVV